MKPSRILILARKELLELRHSPAILLPAVIMTVISVALPFFVAVGIPGLTGHQLTDDADLRRIVEGAAERLPGMRALPTEAAAQGFLLQQFLLLLVLVPVTSAMSVAAHSVIGEKQSRTLEPLLATPITTLDLLLGKVVAALVPALTLEAGALVLYFLGAWWLAAPGVVGVLGSGRALLAVLLFGPLAALIALQLSVTISSRVNDPRGAQQVGVLVIVPVLGLLVAQFTGLLWLSGSQIVLASVGLLLAWLGLLAVGVKVFARETILMRWK